MPGRVGGWIGRLLGTATRVRCGSDRRKPRDPSSHADVTQSVASAGEQLCRLTRQLRPLRPRRSNSAALAHRVANTVSPGSSPRHRPPIRGREVDQFGDRDSPIRNVRGPNSAVNGGCCKCHFYAGKGVVEVLLSR